MTTQLSLFSNKSNINENNQEEIKVSETNKQPLSLTLKLKSKYNQKNKSFFHFSSIETAINPSSVDEVIRKDYYGNVINKKNKENYKVTFIDNVDENKNLVEEIPVESYKEYNYEMYKKSKNLFDKESVCCSESCTII